MNTQIAYLAEGKLYLKLGALAPRQVQSAFAQGVLDRVATNRERNEWKSRNQGLPGSGAGTWWGGGVQTEPADLRTIRITGLTRGTRPGELIYALDTGHVGGLFAYDVATDYEQRLFHKQEFFAQDLARHAEQELIALSLPNPDGTAHIATIQTGGKGLRPLTDGDVLDQAPAWVKSDGQQLVYQTAGLARNAQGMAIAVGPYSIHKLDIDRAQLTALLEDPGTDYLLPRMNADGTLYFIRRPYRPTQRQHTPLQLLKDIVLFPFRLVRAIFAFLNFFSVVFAGKPLTTAGGPQQKMDSRYMMLWGRMIDAEKVLRAAEKGKPVPLVPQDWELVRMTSDGSQAVLAKGVLSYDVGSDGTVVYTNGSEIFHLPADGTPTRLCAQHMIQQVVALS